VSVSPIGMPSIEGLQSPELKPATSKGDAPEGTFSKALSEARGLETEAGKAQERFAADDPGMGIHEVMIATEKANIAVRYAATLKNKALEAYRELMNTQV
jgi:flagellar hook-basal body complex protein FliE